VPSGAKQVAGFLFDIAQSENGVEHDNLHLLSPCLERSFMEHVGSRNKKTADVFASLLEKMPVAAGLERFAF
jgi:hypothetical protein